MKLELGCGMAPTPGYVHHDRRRHAPHVEVAHDLDVLPWPWPDESCQEVLALDVFEHLHLMPEAWLRQCHRLLVPGGVLKLRVPIFGSPWHVMDPTHVRGFHPANSALVHEILPAAELIRRIVAEAEALLGTAPHVDSLT